jgi:hypothetical protein
MLRCHEQTMRKAIAEMLHRSAGALQAEKPVQRQEWLERVLQISLSLEYRQRPNLSFDDVGFDLYSSTGEDGILLYVFSQIGFGDRRCVDIGAGGVEGSNVKNLITHHGFHALLVDADRESIERARAHYGERMPVPPEFLAQRVTVEQVNDALRERGFTGPIDLLCIDIDGVDYWMWKAIEVIEPRVVLIEYQDILGPERSCTVPYRADFDVRSFPVNRERYNYCGASLRALTRLGTDKGYRLVGCNRGGWNAFFVKRGIGDAALPEVSIDSCFRYAWNRFGIENRFPLVERMEWVEV